MFRFFSKNSSLIIVFAVFFVIVLFIPSGVLAALDRRPALQVEIGGYLGQDINYDECQFSFGEGNNCNIDWISRYISAVYKYGVGVAGILAVIMIMIGGFIWLMSGGRTDQIGRAKEYITAALSGLLLAMFSFLILYYVNPDLVSLTSVNIRGIQQEELASVQSVGSQEGVDAVLDSGGTPSTVSEGTAAQLAQIPGAQLLNGADENFISNMNSMVSTLAQNGQLPEGLIVTSGHRPNDTGSEHTNGAVDFQFTGMNLESAQAFEAAIHEFNPNLTVILEIRGTDAYNRYFRGREGSPGVVHVDDRNVTY